jgi:flagellar biosynthesis protein FlhB
MSDTNDPASKTEEPTPRKLEQAREKGDVVRTMDLGHFANLAAVAAVIVFAGGWLSKNLAAHLMPFFSHPDQMVLEGHGGVQVARYAMMAAAPVLAAVMAAAAFSGAAASLVQTGLMFTPSKLKPDFKKVSPGAGFKRIFGIDGLAQFVKSLMKVAATAVLAWWILKPFWPKLSELSALDVSAIVPLTIDILKRLVFAVAALTLVVAGGDWLWQRQRFMARMRMSREELKEDYKQSEGDPHVKARQKQLRNERARRRMMAAVPDATVVIMNPTHYAVALKYEQGEDAAPQCVAKGLDTLAMKIREIAEEAGVPVIEDPPLARALYAAVDIDDMIPPAHYEAVAKIIGFILNAANRRPARSAL